MKNSENNLDTVLRVINDLRAENEELRRQNEWFKRQLFGAKSEKLMSLAEDTALLPGFEASVLPPPEPEKTEHIEAHERKTREKNGWNEMPSDLPREEVVIDVPEAEREGMKLIGYEVSERYARRETRYFIKVIKRAKYADPADAARGVVTAPAPGDFLDSPSGKTKFDGSFVAGVVSDKIENHLPIYRQAEIMAREGVPVNRSTLQSLFTGAAQQLEVLYNRMNELIHQCPVIHGDETPIRLLEPGRGKCKTDFLWVKMTGVGPPLVSFHFANSRKKEVAEELYRDYYGTIIRDHYAGYDDLAAEHAGCWAHVRRRFFEALQAGYRDAEPFVARIRNLYAAEQTAKERADAKGTETALFNERKTARRTSGKLVKEFFEACAKRKTLEVPSSPLAKAVNYALNQQEALEKFLTDPRLNIDNNPAENVIRPLAIGRKNWLFAGNEAGGKHLAILASFSATCKKNNVNFRVWLEDILLKLGSTPSTKIDSLLPHLWNGDD
jgi:transposase